MDVNSTSFSKTCYSDLKSNLVIKPVYDEAEDFYDLAKVIRDGKTMYIDRSGKAVITTEMFQKGLAAVAGK